MSGRDTSGLELNATATSPIPSSSARMPSSATSSGTWTPDTSSP